MNRRQFLASASALTASGLWTPRGFAAPLAGADLNFVFVFNHGGWDMTRALTPAFDLNGVAMEFNAAPLTLGNLTVVDHPERPSVRAFFEQWYQRCLILEGVLVSSIAHDDCILRVMTGTSAEAFSDWPAIIAASSAGAFTLPHLVLGGPSYPGPLGEVVARAGQQGQLAALLSGEVLVWSDEALIPPSTPSVGIIDRYMARRTAARAASARNAMDSRLAGSIDASLQRALELKDFQYVLDLTGGEDLSQQVPLAVEALSLGLCRCLTLGHPGDHDPTSWDSHGENDAAQSPLWEALFAQLVELMALLDRTPGRVGATLADETVVVVLSEMGRSPYMNSSEGKDHWPYTSMMMVGPGVTGDRVVGGWDSGFNGVGVDPASGELDPGGAALTVESIGATLLAMAGIDPAEHVPGFSPVEGILS